MSKYTGSQCMICRGTFTDVDDVVVCPDCGTPYHRACWQQAGRCVNEGLHHSGGSWAADQEKIRLRIGGKVCPKCQFVNMPDAAACTNCGEPLREEDTPQQQDAPAQGFRVQLPDGQSIYFNSADPCCGMSPDDDMAGERLGDVAGFVRSNTLYYIPLFKRFRDTGRKLSLNLSCVIFPHLYFAYRKMWPMALLTVLILNLCSVPSLMLGMLSTLSTPDLMEQLASLYGTDAAMFDGLKDFLAANEQVFQSLYVPLFLVNVAVRLLLCIFGNHLYFRHVLRKVGRIRQTAPTPATRQALLRAEGGTNVWNILGCLGISYALSCGIYMVLFFVFL